MKETYNIENPKMDGRENEQNDAHVNERVSENEVKDNVDSIRQKRTELTKIVKECGSRLDYKKIYTWVDHQGKNIALSLQYIYRFLSQSYAESSKDDVKKLEQISSSLAFFARTMRDNKRNLGEKYDIEDDYKVLSKLLNEIDPIISCYPALSK